jgi:plasmid stabilization system protein ParE
MNYKIEFAEIADNDIDGILHYISQDTPQRAIKFIKSLRDRIKSMLGMFPYSGSRHLGFYYYSFDNYIVIYDVNESTKTVIILMVVESHRQWKIIFSERMH